MKILFMSRVGLVHDVAHVMMSYSNKLLRSVDDRPTEKFTGDRIIFVIAPSSSVLHRLELI